MAKINKPEKNESGKKSFEERLERLELLGEEIRKSDIPLDEAVKAFEEGIVLARALQKDLEKLEGRIEVLMNGTGSETEESSAKPELGLFDEDD
ncbi:MAG: exodeoxyribonuclease VII small subunit [Treponema sp.]|nr:exodeoxyribonuclease VII small subunit [Treponema sp.]